MKAPRLRSRVRQALICPYCRDDISRRGSVVCERRGCGALYHRSCWEECASAYGGCAILGCGSTTGRDLSAAGYFVRVLRLVARAALRADHEGAVELVTGEARFLAEHPCPADHLASHYGRASLLIVWPTMLLAAIAIMAGSAGLIWLVFVGMRAAFGENAALYAVGGPQALLYIGAVAWVVIRCWAYSVSSMLYASRALGRAFRDELGALAESGERASKVRFRVRDGGTK